MIDPTTNPAVLSFAALLPLLIMVLKQAKFPDYVNALIALAVYVAVGIVGAISVSGVPDIHTIVPFITTVTLVGTVAYNMFWSQVQVNGTSLDDAVTVKTSFAK